MFFQAANGPSPCIGLQDESADSVPNKGEMQFAIRGDNSRSVVKPLRFNKDAIIPDGQVQTDTITTKAGAVNDASIALGGELLTNNHTPTQRKQYGHKANSRW